MDAELLSSSCKAIALVLSKIEGSTRTQACRSEFGIKASDFRFLGRQALVHGFGCRYLLIQGFITESLVFHNLSFRVERFWYWMIVHTQYFIFATEFVWVFIRLVAVTTVYHSIQILIADLPCLSELTRVRQYLIKTAI